MWTTEIIKKYITLNGLFIGADHCEIFTKAQKTLQQRVSNASELAQKVAEWLEKDNSLVTVLTPSLPARPCFKIFNDYCELKTSPSVFSDLYQIKLFFARYRKCKKDVIWLCS